MSSTGLPKLLSSRLSSHAVTDNKQATQTLDIDVQSEIGYQVHSATVACRFNVAGSVHSVFSRQEVKIETVCPLSRKLETFFVNMFHHTMSQRVFHDRTVFWLGCPEQNHPQVLPSSNPLDAATWRNRLCNFRRESTFP